MTMGQERMEYIHAVMPTLNGREALVRGVRELTTLMELLTKAYVLQSQLNARYCAKEGSTYKFIYIRVT